MKLQIEISGMGCNHCVAAVQEAIQTQKDFVIQSVTIGSAVVSFEKSEASKEALYEAIEDAGYEVKHVESVS
ncbi:MAG: heavy-metal-associated domain-containing protein [Bacteroidetes Order II. Incertae sedis bacterium]|nr:heavy-metal-associated domain-containing protein [Bacteroidetes Order II. bacterium]